MKTPASDTRTCPAARAADTLFAQHKVALTLGGEPTLIPDDPKGPEWSIIAVGPQKLGYAYKLAAALQKRLPGALPIFSPGKLYPGEVNPRWVLHLFGLASGRPLMRVPLEGSTRKLTPALLHQWREAFVEHLGLPSRWLKGRDRLHPGNRVWILPIDHDEEKGWLTDVWPTGRRATMDLVNAEGPAGLRLPLPLLPEKALRRALVLEWDGDGLSIFLPPLLQEPFAALLQWWLDALGEARVTAVRFQGYLPADEDHRWWRLGLAADPGVLEINLPPCPRWEDYTWWMRTLEEAGKEVGMRSWRTSPDGTEQGTGGGNHLLFGGPVLKKNPFFTRGPWLASMLRYFQRHPVFAYLFSGIYVGTSSQAPRPDESGTSLWDLEMAYAHLASLAKGDHRFMIGETLRHLHTDASGNTHRCETSFDKFWSPNSANGCLGLVEFRAIETLPHADWMAAVALLWRCVAAHTLEVEQPASLTAFGETLHDRYFLPAYLWQDLQRVFTELATSGMKLDPVLYRAIWEWRFPLLLDTEIGGIPFQIRRACEGWPLLCETPTEGGSTSRFVDTSVRRLEILSTRDTFDGRVLVNGRPLHLLPFPGGCGAGLRYRQTALYPSLHPGIPLQIPLTLHVTDAAGHALGAWKFDALTGFTPLGDIRPPDPGRPVIRHGEGAMTYDLRLP